MAQEGHRRDLITYGSMIKGLQKARRHAQIPSYLNMMHEERLRLDFMFVKTLFMNKQDQVERAMADLKRNDMQATSAVLEQAKLM